MPSWIQQVLESPTSGLAILPAALLLGMIGAVTSCCNPAIFAAVAGYSGTVGDAHDKRGILFTGLFFMLGTVVAITVLGVVIGLAGKVAGASLGPYWRLGAGLLLVFFGLASLNLVPFRLPHLGGGRPAPHGWPGAMAYGLAMGGLSSGCAACCNPVLPAVLGYATLQGGSAWGALVLVTFALGYSLPLAAGLVGLGFGLARLKAVAQRAKALVSVVAGVTLVGIGFYLLATI